MNIPLVDLRAQYQNIQPEIDAVVARVLANAEFIGGRPVLAFEQAFASYCGVKHCVGVGNGTDALVIALKALGIGPGDEVLVPANSFIATSEAVTLVGARVVFVDIDRRTFNMDVCKIAEKITPRTRVIIPVHLYGQPAEMDSIMELAAKHNLKVIEDAAQAHGATYKGRRIGTFGSLACFSFYPGKNLGAYGDGGAVVTNDDQLAHKVRLISNHGSVQKYDHPCEGMNSRLDGLQAAILHVKLNHLTAWTERRRAIASAYSERLRGLNLVAPAELERVQSVFHLYVIRVRHGMRDRLLEFLKTKGIFAGIHYPTALPNLKAYAHFGHQEADFPEATKASKEILSLPIYPELEETQMQYVTEAIKEFFAAPAQPGLGVGRGLGRTGQAVSATL